jgi:hypothetical protein
MPTPLDKELYQQVKKHINKIYTKNSAYRSAAYVKLYKDLGGKYKEDTKKKKLEGLPLWFSERWEDVNPDKNKTSYPVYRPTIKVSEKTPKTVDEISKSRLKEQAKLKQVIKGKKNLPPF